MRFALGTTKATNTLVIFNTHRCFTPTMVTRTRLSATLCVHWLSRLPVAEWSPPTVASTVTRYTQHSWTPAHGLQSGHWKVPLVIVAVRTIQFPDHQQEALCPKEMGHSDRKVKSTNHRYLVSVPRKHGDLPPRSLYAFGTVSDAIQLVGLATFPINWE